MISPFEQAVREHTHARPFGRIGRMYRGAVVIRTFKVSQYATRLALIETLPLLRNNGLATKALDFLCELADDHKQTIYLYACAMELTGAPNTSQLIEWYKQFGFAELHDGEMVRFPRGERCTQRNNYSPT